MSLDLNPLLAVNSSQGDCELCARTNISKIQPPQKKEELSHLTLNLAEASKKNSQNLRQDLLRSKKAHQIIQSEDSLPPYNTTRVRLFAARFNF